MTDREIHLMIVNSRKDGFKALFQQYQSYVYTIVWSRLRTVGTAEDAEECISDIFAQIFLHYDDIEEGSLQAYIGTVARNKAVDYFRKLKNEISFYSENEEELSKLDSDVNVENDIEQLEINKILYDKINLLGKPDSTIIIMKYFYGRKSKDIAKQVNMSPVTVRVRLNRALKKLRRLLTDEGISSD